MKPTILNYMDKDRDKTNWFSKYYGSKMDCIFVDRLIDDGDIDKTKSGNYTFNFGIKTTTACDIYTTPITLIVDYGTPNYAFVIGDYTLGDGGSVTFYLSRDGGTTFTKCTEGITTSLTNQPTPTTVILKIHTEGNVFINAYGYGWGTQL